MLASGQLLSILSVATALLMLGSGIYVLFSGLRALWAMPAPLSQTIGMRLAARRWPAAPGIIIGAEVRVTPESGEEPFYDAVVRYAYTVQGQEYEGAQDDLTYVSNAQDAALAIVARYPVGAAVPVYYDPQVPQRALIDRGIRPHHLVSLLFASLFPPPAGGRRSAGNPDGTGDAGSAGSAASRLSSRPRQVRPRQSAWMGAMMKAGTSLLLERMRRGNE